MLHDPIPEIPLPNNLGISLGYFVHDNRKRNGVTSVTQGFSNSLDVHRPTEESDISTCGTVARKEAPDIHKVMKT